jgi:hypothetical protein
MIEILPFAEWLPDQPDAYNPGSTNILNVYPRTAQSYGPVKALVPYSTTGLLARCQGGFPAIDSSETITLFAGDASNLYALGAGSTAWNVVSKSAGAYSCPSSAFWAFQQFGQNVYASNNSNPLQQYSLSGGTFSDVTGAPQGKFMAVVRDFLVMANTYDAVNGTLNQRVWWSAINNPTNWPTVGSTAAQTVQSDAQDIAGTQGQIQGIFSQLGYCDAAVFFEHAIYRMQYIGYPVIFEIQAAEGARGTPAPYSCVQFGAVVYYLGEDGFYMFDGANSTPIGAQKFDVFFFGDVNKNFLYRMQGAVDPVNRLILWSYPSTASTTGTPDSLIIYNPVINRSSLVRGISLEYMLRLLTIGYSLESLSAIYPNLDTVPYSLDDQIWTGGNIIIGAFDSATHNLNYFTGAALAATLETPEKQLNPDGRTYLKTLRPITDAPRSVLTAQDGSEIVNTLIPYDTIDLLAPVTAAVAARETIGSAVAYAAALPINQWGTVPAYASGRFHRAQVNIPSGAVWNHAQGVEVDFSPQGVR